MFNDKKTTQKNTLEINRISNGTTIVGDIVSESDFRIDGTIEGSIKTSKRVIIGKAGKVQGSVFCQNADIEGTFSGNLTVTEMLTLRSSAVITGEVVISKLAVEPGASFNVTCSMKTTVKDMHAKATKKTA